MQWAPRFVQAPAFFQIIACLAFASVWRLHRHACAGHPRQTLAGAVLGLGLLGAVGLGIRFQLTAAPLTGEVNRLRPPVRLSSADHADADSRLADFELVAEIDGFVLLKRRAGKNGSSHAAFRPGSACTAARDGPNPRRAA